MTREEISQKLAAAKTNKSVPDSLRPQLISLYEKQLAEFDNKEPLDLVSEKNINVIDEFYCSNQTFVTKEELIAKGFDFSQWFTTSNLRHYFDNEENVFEYKDFKCGVYYIKTRDKNLEEPDKKARLFFQIIKLEYDRNTAEFNNAIKLLHDRKFAAGHAWAYSFDMEMRDQSAAKRSENELANINKQIDRTLPRLKELINSLKHTLDVYADLYERLDKKETEDEQWI